MSDKGQTTAVSSKKPRTRGEMHLNTNPLRPSGDLWRERALMMSGLDETTGVDLGGSKGAAAFLEETSVRPPATRWGHLESADGVNISPFVVMLPSIWSIFKQLLVWIKIVSRE